MMGLSLYYATAGEKQGLLATLHRHYRGEVIRMLGAEVAKDDADWKDKMAFTYLRAELQRRSGTHDQAREGFARVIKDARKRGINPADENAGMSWALRWAKEQSELNDRGITAAQAHREEDENLTRARSALLPAAKAALVKPEAFPPAKMKSDDVLDGLEKLLRDGTDEEARLAARMYTRLLKQAGEEPRDANQHGLTVYYITQRRVLLAPEILKELDGEWRSTFWENLAAYLARRDGAGAALASHPLVTRKWDDGGRPFEDFLWRRFGECVDPIWVEKAVKELSRKKWIQGDALDYALEVDDPRLAAALEKRHAWLVRRGWWKPGGRGADDGDAMLLDHEAQDIEDWMRGRKLAALPVK